MPETEDKRPRGRPRRNPNEVMDAFVGIRMPRALLERLTYVAEEAGVTRNQFIVDMLKLSIADAKRKKR